jgi:hypothetical protein
MSRYDNSQTAGGNGDNDYDDDITLKLQQYAAVRLTPAGLNRSGHEQFGTSLIQNYEDAAVLDGIVFQRDDKPNTWKVFSAGKFFNLNPADGGVYEQYSEDDGYTGKMSAQDIIEHKRVGGFSESFGGEDYFYTLVGAVIEADDDVALTGDVDVETDDGGIVVGDASMLSSNRTWVRTYAKKLTEAGPDAIADNGDDPTPRGEPDTNPKYTDHDWLAPDDPTLRSELEGRSLELWVTETTETMEDGEDVTYEVPNVEDVKTGEAVTIDNGDGGNETEADGDKVAAADGGTATAGDGSTGTPESTDEPAEPSVDDEGLPDGVPESLDDLLDFIARNNDDPTADDVRAMAENEVEDPDAIDWAAAAGVADSR